MSHMLGVIMIIFYKDLWGGASFVLSLSPGQKRQLSNYLSDFTRFPKFHFHCSNIATTSRKETIV